MNIHLEAYLSSQQKQVKSFILSIWKEFGFVYMQEFDSDLDDPYIFYMQKGGMFYLLLDSDKIIGTIGIINRGNNIAELKRFYIDPDYREKGYGTQLFKRAIAFCKKNRFQKIEFETAKAFKKAHEFYKKRGFNIVKEDENSYYMELVV